MDVPLHELFVRFVLFFSLYVMKNSKIHAKTVSLLIIFNSVGNPDPVVRGADSDPVPDPSLS